MSERKVLNKYYPPDYDPALIPKLKRAADRQYVIRVMAPFHMRCKTCGNYIYKGTKFNSRKETVQDEDYIGLRIFRFYIKCTRCVAEITFKTDPENMDYKIEHGATRNFEAEKLLEKQEKEIQRQQEEDEGNPMKLLEMRTKDSKREMELLENLEELKDLSKRKAALNYEGMIQRYRETEEEKQKREAEEDEKEMKSIFGSDKINRIEDSDESDEEVITQKIVEPSVSASSILVSGANSSEPGGSSKLPSTSDNKESLKKKAKLLGIVKKRPPPVSKELIQSDTNSEPEVKKLKTNNYTSTNNSGPKTSITNNSNSNEVAAKPPSVGGLGLLGSYGSDDSGSSSED